MDAEEAVAGYRSIRCQLESGQVTLERYNERVAELRYQDHTGTWWAISPQDGRWLTWTGSTWAAAFEQAAPASVPQTTPLKVSQDAGQPSGYIPPVTSRPGRGRNDGTQDLHASAAGEPPAGSSPFTLLRSRPDGGECAVATKTLRGTAVGGAGKPAWFLAAIGSLLLGILSWVLFPFILGILSIAAGGCSLYLSRKTAGRITPLAPVAVLIALAAMAVEYLASGDVL